MNKTRRLTDRFQTLAVVLLALAAASCSPAEKDGDEVSESTEAIIAQPMTTARLGDLIRSVDKEATLEGTTWQFTVAELDAAIIYDIAADRMRIVIPIGPSDDIEPEELIRLMQANFDSVLDARYAIAQGILWGAYIHPLSTLTDEEFLAGLGQTANVVLSFGTSYSSGMFMFNGGDSAEIEQQKLLEELRKHRT